MVPLYQSVISGLLIGLKGEISGSLGVYPKQTSRLDALKTHEICKGFNAIIERVQSLTIQPHASRQDAPMLWNLLYIANIQNLQTSKIHGL